MELLSQAITARMPLCTKLDNGKYAPRFMGLKDPNHWFPPTVHIDSTMRGIKTQPEYREKNAHSGLNLSV
jgi:hypothetical protein